MYQTEKTERYDLEESGEFLQAVEDPGRTAQNILDELDYQVGFFAGLADWQKKKGWVWNCTDAGDGGDADQAPPSQLKHTLLLQQSAMETQGDFKASTKMIWFKFSSNFLDPQGGLLAFWTVDQPNDHTSCLLSGNSFKISSNWFLKGHVFHPFNEICH